MCNVHIWLWWWIFTWDFVDISLCFSFLWIHLFSPASLCLLLQILPGRVGRGFRIRAWALLETHHTSGNSFFSSWKWNLKRPDLIHRICPTCTSPFEDFRLLELFSREKKIGTWSNLILGDAALVSALGIHLDQPNALSSAQSNPMKGKWKWKGK